MSVILPALENINLSTRNTEIPFYPSFTYGIVEADKGVTLPPFFWIAAYFDATQFTGFPVLAVWSGGYRPDGVTPQVSGVYFAYPGERIQIKGTAILSSGTDIRGNPITSTVIGSTPTTQISKVIVYGGMY